MVNICWGLFIRYNCYPVSVYRTVLDLFNILFKSKGN
jgi:hypothetical protein